MTAGELVHITLKMLGSHAVVGSVVAALKERPEALNPVGVGLGQTRTRGRCDGQRRG